MGILAGTDREGPSLERRAVAEAFVEVVGERIALLGREAGAFECWMWPLQVLEELRLAPVGSAVQERRVRVEPAGLVVVEEGEGWRLRQELFACRERRALAVLLALEGSVPLEVELSLRCAFRPMWPAGLGGAIAALDGPTGALLLTEELGRFAFLAGWPGARVEARLADHSLPAGPVRLRLRLEPGAVPPPIVLAGAEREPRPLSAEALLGREQAAVGLSRAREVVDDARALWSELVADAPGELERLREDWRARLARATRLVASDPAFERAMLWSHVALERAWTRVEGLGRGLVAGLAPAGASARPGYGWFFDGDALAASRALVGLGDHEGAAEVLRFAASHQRADGKLMHELTLSARLCDWLASYPYAYYKGVNAPDFVAALDHALGASGDAALRGELAPAAERALRWCAACTDEAGRLSNAKAGIAAVEAGPLSDAIESETFLHGAWLAALDGAARLAEAGAREALAREIAGWRARAEHGLETFWSEERGRYGVARLAGGRLLDDLSAYLAVPLARGFGLPEHALATARALNRPELAADWGLRMFASDSEVYDPAHYNTGSVFPYLTGFGILAQYRHGLLHSGLQLLASQVALVGFGALGFLQEHLVGDVARVPERGVPHQIFSSAALVESIVFGLLGFAPDAERGLAVLRPHLPAAWERVGLERLRLGASRFDLLVTRARDAGGTARLRLALALREGPPLTVRLEPRLPALSRVHAASVAGAAGGDPEPLAWNDATLPSGALSVRLADLRLASTLEVELALEEGPSPLLAPPDLEPGAPSRAVRIVEEGWDGEQVAWRLFGPAGGATRLELRGGRRIELEGDPGVRREGDALLLDFPPDPAGPGGAAGAFSSLALRLRAGSP